MYVKKRSKGLSRKIQTLRRRATPAEKAMKIILESLGVRFIFQKGVVYGRNRYYIVDFYLSTPNKIVIEVQGGYHKTYEQRIYDKAKRHYFENIKKFTFLEFTNEEVLNCPEAIKEKIKSHLSVLLRVEGGR